VLATEHRDAWIPGYRPNPGREPVSSGMKPITRWPPRASTFPGRKRKRDWHRYGGREIAQ